MNLQKDELRKVYGQISPFEFKDKLIRLAKANNDDILDAGRGNPNWTASTPREAFFTFGQFAIKETQRTWCKDDLAGMPEKKNIAKRFKEFLENSPQTSAIELLANILKYGIEEMNFDADEYIYELTDGIIGDNYPVPDRMLIHIEKIVHNYLMKELCQNKKFESNFEVFAVEGGTAAMCYIFDSLVVNNLLKSGDTIALMTPIFTPYLEIPHLPNYKFNVINIKANEVDENGNPTWQYPKEELNKLKDKNIKVLFVVNPNNPASIALSRDCKDNLISVVKEHNPELMIVTDDVYCTFVDNFNSLVSELPYNTLGVYSYSKYFGVTGWRLGTIFLNEKNIFNDLIKKLSPAMKNELNERYKHLCQNPTELSFMDRLVADSRQVALNHTAGLSTPQQVQMAFFSLFALIDKENNYKQLTKDICKIRKNLLFNGLELEYEKSRHDAAYYTELNILDIASMKYGNTFAQHIKENYSTFDVLYDLAKEHGVILLNGDGFASSKWSIRVSLANLKDGAYPQIGIAIKNLIDNLYNTYLNL